jgi:putative component of toxin-antitoxin plasmid stabilization module
MVREVTGGIQETKCISSKAIIHGYRIYFPRDDQVLVMF